MAWNSRHTLQPQLARGTQSTNLRPPRPCGIQIRELRPARVDARSLILLRHVDAGDSAAAAPSGRIKVRLVAPLFLWLSFDAQTAAAVSCAFSHEAATQSIQGVSARKQQHRALRHVGSGLQPRRLRRRHTANVYVFVLSFFASCTCRFFPQPSLAASAPRARFRRRAAVRRHASS